MSRLAPARRSLLTSSRSAMTSARAVVAEFVGTALLLSAIVGSGIMAERLFGGNAGLALLANAIATGGALAALILAFGPTSGAHFNPAVTLADAWQGGLPWRQLFRTSSPRSPAHCAALRSRTACSAYHYFPSRDTHAPDRECW